MTKEKRRKRGRGVQQQVSCKYSREGVQSDIMSAATCRLLRTSFGAPSVWTCSPSPGFYTRPELRVNTFISEMAARFRQSAQQEAEGSEKGRQRFLCDVCVESKLKALKSCVVCSSYCETHLKPHQTKSSLRETRADRALGRPEFRLCRKHDKLIELFCKTDRVGICMLCSISEHKTHHAVPMKEYTERERELKKMDHEITDMIIDRSSKLHNISLAGDYGRKDADREIDRSEVFRILHSTVWKGKLKFINRITKKQKRAEKRAEAVVRGLEKEISVLKRRRTGGDFKISLPSYEGSAVRALAEMDERLSEQRDMMFELELKRFQNYAVDVKLDPNTARSGLVLSDDGKQVHHSDVQKELPDNPERFDTFLGVLGHRSFRYGKFYYEVEVKGKTEWDLGVVTESVSRKGEITASPQNGFWTISLRNEKEFTANADSPVSLSLQWNPEKVGVFVDFEDGLVSFYDVNDFTPIYSFSECCFTERFTPFFSPGPNHGGKNATPLTVTPVDPTEHVWYKENRFASILF
ncbi:E3 ubiquitin-protein ligase TRIM21-like [Archocentrus centrarchus]|uniref:E3 ubiquitin-protein ligase TRIM21-like n=1 Tax=Archocentrus centrarchus TaxID=63155 RepID=UPI0011E9B381|nr:E3 ubiquitin-protein ligase TRIM21-like [Archocentrus centrarchus]